MIIDLDQAVALLKKSVVALPTETVYGLAASINSPEAISAIFSLKNRPPQNPLIIHVSSVEEIYSFTEKSLPKQLVSLWPGPLTLILPVKGVSEKVTAGLSTAAFRIPDHPLTLEILRRTGPLVAPSANLSGKPSATHPSHVERDFGKNFPVVDGGASEKGLESTILAEKEGLWRILREGAIPQEAFLPLLGYLPEIVKPASKPECPGQMFRHYSPDATLVLEGDCEAVLGFRERVYDKPTILLGSLDHAEEVAARLYHALREVDEKGYQIVKVDFDFPSHGLWKTIRERLQKALKK